jgi:hypothetical protein
VRERGRERVEGERVWREEVWKEWERKRGWGWVSVWRESEIKREREKGWRCKTYKA